MTARLPFAPAPLVGIPACFRDLDGLPFHVVADKYARAVAEATGAIPLILPAFPEREIAPLLARLDGLLITGSPSMVGPERYDGPAIDPGTLLDPVRDAVNLPLIPTAVAAGIPLLAICRGFQELNVAYGGSLHQKLQDLPDRRDHRAAEDLPYDQQYGPSHAIHLASGGMLDRLLGGGAPMVNSLHWQGVDRVGAGLVVEATADDGTVEALSVERAPNFALGVQWHPEFRHAENPVSRAIFGAFDAAIRQRSRRAGRAAA